ncbi:aminotransferase class I/II-fold pyridoxal phosphate-dependent enzyme [Pelosinus fermentans]|uniref:Aminotransferase class I and II n=1 Tax=Pelosinus fermentans JBW45 TaxID=1192197 RepID=I8U3P3_9FIRM|nr:aminotransferase class I/II-fold pyridoxal phosphate-dependent enzyme [Pelosinus fermentans]AJQ28186.1 aminotransferase class I and II [Pelosinus fermentans JBW45]
MTYSVAASHAKGKCATDKIFGANAAAAKAAAQYGKNKVVNATIGAFMDEQERLACIPTVEKVFKNFSINHIIPYAPIAGLPDYLAAMIELTFADHKPEAYIDAVATAGGTGAIHHTIWNYSEIGDTILTSDWYWGPYKILCQDALRTLDTYTLFDDQQKFNIGAFSAKVREIIAKQNNLVIIINTPAHNPTGFSLSDSDWDQVLDLFKDCVKDTTKHIIPLIDIAYIDYAGEKNACRSFLKKFGNLPANILPILACSMSKGFTMYGQRTGVMIGISSNKEIITEFQSINQFTSRATWSNINYSAMKLLADIYQDKSLLAQTEQERGEYYALIRKRADIFMREAQEVNLHILPYIAGFFITVPVENPEAVCEKLHDDHIFAVPLAKGIRIAVCAVTSEKMTGMAGKFAKAIQAVSVQ